MRVERGGMDLVWVKSVFWFVKYVDFYVIFVENGSRTVLSK